MKTLFRLTFALLALVLVAPATSSAQDASIVYLDSERLREEWADLREAREQLQQRMPALEAQADSVLRPLQARLQQLAVEYQQQQGAMSQQARQEQEGRLQQAQRELQQTGAQWEQRAAQLQSEILGPPLSQINQVIETLRQERGYDLILDGSTAGIVAADPALDITDEVLRRLRAGGSQDS